MNPDQEIKVLLGEILEQLRELARSSDQTRIQNEIHLTRDEAMQFVGIKSHSGFTRWCQRAHYTPRVRGRHSKARLAAALKRYVGE